MVTTNLFVIANVKQMRTGGSSRILLPFFQTSWCVGVLNSAIFKSFHNRVEFGTIFEGLRNFREGVLKTPNPPRYATASKDYLYQITLRHLLEGSILTYQTTWDHVQEQSPWKSSWFDTNLRWSLRINFLLQTGHVKFFSPVWVRVWRASSSERAKRFPQPAQPHGKGRSPATIKQRPM